MNKRFVSILIILSAATLLCWLWITLASAQTYIQSVEIEYRDGTRFSTTQPAWLVKSISSDGIGDTRTYPAAAPATRPVYAKSWTVGVGKQLRMDDVPAKIADNTCFIFSRGENFPQTQNLTTNGKTNVGFYAAAGEGNKPSIVWRRNNDGSMWVIGGKKMVVEGLRFENGTAWKAVEALDLRADGIEIRNVDPHDSLHTFMHYWSARNVVVDGCGLSKAKPSFYWAYSGLKPGATEFSDHVLVKNSYMTAGVHVQRWQAINNLTVRDSVVRGWDAVSTAVASKDGTNHLYENLDIEGAIVVGPLNKDDGKPEEILHNVAPVFRNCKIKLGNKGSPNNVFAVCEGVQNLLVTGCIISSPTSWVFGIEFDTSKPGYALRGRATGVIRGNRITGPAGVKVVKGGDGLVTASDNIVSGVPQ